MPDRSSWGILPPTLFVAPDPRESVLDRAREVTASTESLQSPQLSGLPGRNDGRSTRATSLDRERILSAFIEDARTLPTQEEFLVKIGKRVENLHLQWERGEVDEKTVYSELRLIFQAVVDDALARGGHAAGVKVVTGVAEGLQQLPFGKKLAKNTADGLEGEINQYFVDRMRFVPGPSLVIR